MERALINFSFDDGRRDNFDIAYPILKHYDCPATFNITTGYITGEMKKGALTYAEPMNMAQIQEMFNDPSLEIAGHGYWHKNTLADITDGLNSLKRALKVKKPTKWGNGFASPGTALDLEVYNNEIKPVLENEQLQYIRLSLRYKSHAAIKTFVRKLTRILHWPWLYSYAYKDTLMSSADDVFLYSVPILSSISVAEIMALVRRAVKEKKACVLMMHSIVEKGRIQDPWDFEKDKFESLVHEIKKLQTEGKLTITTSMNIYQQLKGNN